MSTRDIRLGADIGGTFTDIVLDRSGEIFSAKVLTDYTAPEQGILDGIAIVIQQAGIGFSDLDIIVHGTTLASNALIERRGAKTALVTTDGFRDVIEMRTESRFRQYDLNLKLPDPLIPRQDRFPVRGRINSQGYELQPLDEKRLDELAGVIREGGFGSVAVGFIHSYQNPVHEQRAREILSMKLPDIPISISSEVSPQMREYERFNTVCANAYVRPLIEDYLKHLELRVKDAGADCPVFMIHSGGGLISIEDAAAFPVRLVESGPAGGAIFAAEIAARFGFDKVASYDMGGTTAKICLIEKCQPRSTRTFEVARTDQFCKGSGMPVSVPAIEMIEIGAGGGSIAQIDAMGRIQTGPESAASEPGPACYQRGGEWPTITDADLLLGKIDPNRFAGGAFNLSEQASRAAVDRDISHKLSLETLEAAFGICEVADENMANAARVHAVENGKSISENVMIAFGGAAPLHAARLCEKLGIDQCLIPSGAGVGSAIGFLKAPFGYEALISRLVRLGEFDAEKVNVMLDDLRKSAEKFVRSGTDGPIKSEVVAFMRYRGQGWEIPVPLPDRPLTQEDVNLIHDRYFESYTDFFGKAIEGMDGLEVEIVTWSVKITEIRPESTRQNLLTAGTECQGTGFRSIFDSSGSHIKSRVAERDKLAVGDCIKGPAVIVEHETSTVVTSSFDAVIQGDHSILLTRKEI